MCKLYYGKSLIHIVNVIIKPDRQRYESNDTANRKGRIASVHIFFE